MIWILCIELYCTESHFRCKSDQNSKLLPPQENSSSTKLRERRVQIHQICASTSTLQWRWMLCRRISMCSHSYDRSNGATTSIRSTLLLVRVISYFWRAHHSIDILGVSRCNVASVCLSSTHKCNLSPFLLSRTMLPAPFSLL